MTDPLMRSHSGWSWRLYHDMIFQDALYDGMMYGTIVTISQLWESYRKYRERGIRNTRARLQQLYGKAHNFSLNRAPGGGAQVRLEIHFRLQGGELLNARHHAD